MKFSHKWTSRQGESNLAKFPNITSSLGSLGTLSLLGALALLAALGGPWKSPQYENPKMQLNCSTGKSQISHSTISVGTRLRLSVKVNKLSKEEFF